ncbi:MAG TPA: adenylate/guanylate cyclase domain-containing protein [Flavilitoribacter sp.]|nr:adenylate/guanylate cyclase domain-containing protein [Flavilitoribacter sp.]
MNYFMSNRIKSQLRKIFWITVGWTLISLYQYFHVYSVMAYSGISVPGFDPILPLRSSFQVGILGGLMGGSGIVFVWERWLRTRNYGWALMQIFFSYTLVFLAVSIPVVFSYQSALLHLPVTHPEVRQVVADRFLSISQLESYLFWLFVTLGTLIVLLVNDKYGPGVFKDFLLGKYFHPKREERIFMFLDLRSSTTIAERLGEQRYFNFIKDVFRHSTPAIQYSKGEIYQYVGDEIVISWKTGTGTENANCIRCFFEIQRILKEKAGYYQATYEETPEFKAGLHYGYVMAGEIGVVKRDIAFSGDVLNTTARIQAKCNELGVDILFSKFLLDRLALPPNSFSPRKIGDMILRGKKQEVVLYTI